MKSLITIFFAISSGIGLASPKTPETSSPVIPFPPELLSCEKSTDCTVVPGMCGEWQVVNTKSATDFAASNNKHRPAIECAQGKSETRLPQPNCVQGFCETKSSGGKAAVAAWSAHCPKREKVQAKIRNPSVLLAIDDLENPIDIVQLRGLQTLAHAGQDALPAVPRIVTLLREAQVTPALEQTCRIPQGLEERPYLETLRALGPIAAGAVPDLIELLPGEDEIQKQEDYLELFAAIGPGAAPAVPFLIQELSKHNANGIGDYRAALCIRALAAIGPPSQAALPILRQIVVKGGNYEALSLRAMISIAPGDPLTRSVVTGALDSPHVETEKLAIRYIGLYPGDVAAEIPLLLKVAKNTHQAEVPLAVVRAIGNSGKAAQPFLVDLVELRGKHSDNSDILVAARKLDKSGKVIGGLLEKSLLDPSEHLAAVRFLIGMKTIRARESTLPSLLHYSLGKKTGDGKVKDFIPKLCELVADSHRAPSIRTAAIDALVFSENDDDKFKAALTKAMGDSQHSVKWEASGAKLLVTGIPEAHALKLQLEALEGSALRVIDTAEVVDALPVVPESFESAIIALARKTSRPAATLAWTALAVKHDAEGRKEWMAEVAKKDSRLAATLIRGLGVMTDIPNELTALVISRSDTPILLDAVTVTLENIGSAATLEAARKTLVMNNHDRG